MNRSGRTKAKRFAKQERWRAMLLDQLTAWFKDRSLQVALGVQGADRAGRRKGKDHIDGTFSDNHIED